MLMTDEIVTHDLADFGDEDCHDARWQGRELPALRRVRK